MTPAIDCFEDALNAVFDVKSELAAAGWPPADIERAHRELIAWLNGVTETLYAEADRT